MSPFIATGADAATHSKFHHTSGRQFRPVIIFYFLVVCMGSVSYGYSASVISTTLVQTSFINAMGLAHNPNADTLIGLTGSMYQLGGVVGTFTVSFFSDRYGRRIGIAVPAVLGIVAAALLAGSVNMNMFIAMRFLAGVAAYNIVASVPVWMAEVAPPNVRGMLVDLHGTFLLLGYAIAAYVGYGFFKLDSPSSWRAHQTLNIVPNLLLLSGLWLLPESPRWLLMQHRPEEARQVLDRLHTSTEAAVEFEQIRLQVQIDEKLDSSYRAFFTKKSYRKRAIICFTIPAGIQLAGPIVLNNYGPRLYAALGYSSEKQWLYQIGWLTLSVGGGVASIFAIDHFKRPRFIAFGIQFCLCCLAVEAALVATYANEEALTNPNPNALRAAVAMLFVFVFVFEVCLDGAQVVYISEVCPTHLRAKGISLGMAGLCVMNIIWLQVAPTAFANIGWRFYLCFIIPGTVFVCWLLYWYPDTRGLPLEEIAGIFGDASEVYTDPVQPSETMVDRKEDSDVGKAEIIEQPPKPVHLEQV